MELVDHEISLGYDDLSYFEIMEKIIPSEIGVPTGFETVGHLAHFNLKETQYPYKKIIGEVLLSKYKNIKTVANKLEKLHNVYRTPEL